MAHRVEPRVLGTTTTTGTGALTLAVTAVTGHRTVQGAPIAVGDTFWGYVEAVDANGNATGDYEEGLCTYSATDTVTRSTVSRSSNSNAAVSFAAGTKRVGITAWFGQRQAATPAANQNDYAPNTIGEFIRAEAVEIAPTASIFITGLAATFDGHRVRLLNTSSLTAGFGFTLRGENASSSAANRFGWSASEPLWVLPGEWIELTYSGTLSRWCCTGKGARRVFDSHNTNLGVVDGAFGAWQPAGGTTTLTAIGSVATATGTATAVANNNTNVQGRNTRVEALVTTAATTAVAGWRHTGAPYFRGDAADRGGFFVNFMWGPATGVTTGTRRAFAGLAASTAAPTDVQPSSQVNCIGMGYDAADTNMQLMHNDGSGTATKVDLGFARPSADRTSWYELWLYSPPNGSGLHYLIRDASNDNLYTGVITSADIPSSTTFLAPRVWSSVGGTSSVTGVAVGNCRFYSPF